MRILILYMYTIPMEKLDTWRPYVYTGAMRLLYLQYWIFGIQYFESAKKAQASESWWTPKRINYCRWIVATLYTLSIFTNELNLELWIRRSIEQQYFDPITSNRMKWADSGSFLAYILLCVSVSLYSTYSIYKTVQNLAQTHIEMVNMNAFLVNTIIIFLQVVFFGLFFGSLGLNITVGDQSLTYILGLVVYALDIFIQLGFC